MTRAIRFEHASTLPVPVGRLWQFHVRPDALALLTPPFPPVRQLDRGDGVADGSVVRLRLGLGPLGHDWTALHTGVRAGRSFTDIALESPFPCWVHLHSFEELTRATSRLTDVVLVVPPRWLPGRPGRALLRFALRRLFAWRHGRTRALLVGRPRRPGLPCHRLAPAPSA